MDIDVVIIGINAQETLENCIQGVLSANYPQEKIHIYYVDGGSIDNSVSIAGSFAEVSIVKLNNKHPTPGMGRNFGWRKGHSSWIQFLDSDTILDPEWLKNASEYISIPNVVAISGNRKEMHPKNFFNWIGDLEWNAKPGEVFSFGGDVLLKREALVKTTGYNEQLVAGEDPELALRMRLKGGTILQLDKPMTQHDLGMRSITQYLKRSYRTGYGYAAVYEMHSKSTSMWRKEVFRIIIRGGLFIVLLALAIFIELFIIPALIILFYPLCKVQKFAREKNITIPEAFLYALHCSVVVLPQLCGVLRYYCGSLLNKPLHNNVKSLKTHNTKKSD
jgi:glycosyltransferase involved in cell wall biosynthesis